MSEKILDIQDERLSFFTPAGEVKALNGVSFAMNQGDVLGIVGESGSGKSVTAYSIMGLTAYPGKLVGGKVWFNGHQVDEMSEKDFRKIRGNEVSIIFQDPMTSLNPVYTIGNQIVEVILLHTKKSKKEAWARAKELLELVGINEPERRLKQYPHELSGGMRQRVMIAMALACEPDILIADEPTTALDVTIQAQILELMQDLQKEFHLTYMFITHDLSVVYHISDEIMVMYLGQVIEKAPAEKLFANPVHPYTQALLSAIPVPDIHKTKKRQVLEGEVPSPIHKPDGCPFHNRCPQCMEICKTQAPRMVHHGAEGHMVACHLYDKEAPKA